jgi:hypothetical protein
MQRCYSKLVHGIWICPRLNERDNGRSLRRGILGLRTRCANGRGVEWLLTEPVSRVDIRIQLDEIADQLRFVTGRSNVQCRVARVDVSRNSVEVVSLCRCAGRTGAKTRYRQTGRRCEKP